MSTAIDSRWWTDAYEGRRYEAVTRVVRQIRLAQSYRKVDDLAHASLYANRPISGFGIGMSRTDPAAASRITVNVVRNMVGAVTSKVAAKNKPKPTFLPDGGDYEDEQNCEMLEQFVGGVFYQEKVYQQLNRCFRDACVWGTAFLKITDGEGKVCVERVRPVEIVVDDMEAIDGQPPNLYQRKYVDRLVLQHLWASGEDEASKELWKKIESATGSSEDIEYAYQTSADQVLVTESWHVGEGKGVKGRHSITIENADLFDEPWEGEFPFSVLRWSDDVEGFFGVGLAEELRGIQEEINKLLAQIQRGHHLISGHYLVEGNAKVQTQQLNNDLAAIVRYTGTAPRYEAPQAINAAVYKHLWDLYDKAYEIAGISQLSATGQKPPGLDSGIAQRTYQDIQTERFLEVGQAYEEFVIEAARQVVRCAKKIGGKYNVRAIGKYDTTAIDWSEIDLDKDPVIKVQPTSLIPTTPAGKLQWMQDMINSKAIPAEDVLDAVDMPDTKAYSDLALAPRRIIQKNIADILKNGKGISPEPFDDHKLALRLVNQAYHKARLSNVPEPKLELLRRYMADSADLAGVPDPSVPPPPAPPMGPPGMAPPMGGPPPPMAPPMGPPPMGQAA